MPRAIPTINTSHDEKNLIAGIIQLNNALLKHFSDTITPLDKSLSLQAARFQANKNRAFYRWYKYKEAFSAGLVEQLLSDVKKSEPKMLDPFAGSGTALFVGASLGFDTHGIELLPVGQEIIAAQKNCIGRPANKIMSTLKRWVSEKPWKTATAKTTINTLRITQGAYPKKTKKTIERYLSALSSENPAARQVLNFALLCVLESVSYTHKDGQYLRWDCRSGRRNGQNTFYKRSILGFDEAIDQKLNEIINDVTTSDISGALSARRNRVTSGKIGVFAGSCLDIMPEMDSLQYGVILTSPPYCNRYDYTRTYALEHAILDVSDEGLVNLRQRMLSCTVENRPKELATMNSDWTLAISLCDEFPLLQSILNFLNHKKLLNELNNNGIPRMVSGYFYEMACVIQECYRLLANDGTMIMVNDNVRYAGVSIPVDTILSKIAEDIGFRIKNILVLPQNKGNSSQQMKTHGRDTLRRSVCVWGKNPK